MLVVPAVIEPVVTGVAATGFEEIADASPLGAHGTFAVGGAAAVVSVVGAIFALRGVDGLLRSCVAVLLGVFAGIIAVVAFILLLAGGMPILFAILLLHATFSIGMIARAV